MHEGFAKRHDIENLTVLVTDLVEEAQAADLIFLRRRSEGEADAVQHFGLGDIEVDEINRHVNRTVLAVAFEIEVVRRHAADNADVRSELQKEKRPT